MPNANAEVIEEITEKKTIDDTMNAVVADIVSRETDPTKAKLSAEQPGATGDSEGKVRHPDGTFAKTDKNVTPPDPLKKGGKEGKDAEADGRAAQRPPASWSAAAKAKFAALEPDIQKEVLKREDDFHKGIEQYKAKATLADTLYREIQPYEAVLRSEGVTPEVAVRSLMNAAYTLRAGTPQQKAQLIQDVAQTYGIDLSGLVSGEVPEIDPSTQALQNRLASLEGAIANSFAQRQQHDVQTLTQQIEQFRNDPKNLYFDDVRQDMGVLIQNGRAQTLPDAYEMAIWAQPDIRALLLAQQQQASDQGRLEAAKRSALEAQRSQSVNVRSRNTSFSDAPVGKTIDDTLNAVFDDIQSRSAN